MRNPSGYGGITKLSGKRRRPWRVRITVGWEKDDEKRTAKQIFATLGYTATKKEAMQMLAEYNKNPYDLAKKDITFAEVYAIWSEKHYKKHPSTQGHLSSAYKKYCAPLHEMRMADIRLAHMQDILDDLSGKSRSLQANIMNICHNVFAYCVKNDILQKDYSKLVSFTNEKSKSTEKKFFTPEEISAVLASQDYTSARGRKIADVVIVLLYTGLRINELLHVKASDVDIDKRIMHVHGTKTDAAKRIVPIHRDIIPILKKRLATCSTYLIEHDGKPILYESFRNFWVEYMAYLNISHTPHATRHTFISIMDDCGVTGVTLKRIVGHANKDVTEDYTHKRLTILIDAIDKFKLPDLETHR